MAWLNKIFGKDSKEDEIRKEPSPVAEPLAASVEKKLFPVPEKCPKCDRDLACNKYMTEQENGTWIMSIPADLMEAAIAAKQKLAKAKSSGVDVEFTKEELAPGEEISRSVKAHPMKCNKCDQIVCGECSLNASDKCLRASCIRNKAWRIP